MFTKEIKVLIGDTIKKGTLIVEDDKITFRQGNYSISKTGKYPFMILREIREELERKGTFLMINASRKDVYPSGMSKSGNKAYILVLGKKGSFDDLVDIFNEFEDIDLIATVEDQINYHTMWLSSIRTF